VTNFCISAPCRSKWWSWKTLCNGIWQLEMPLSTLSSWGSGVARGARDSRRRIPKVGKMPPLHEITWIVQPAKNAGFRMTVWSWIVLGIRTCGAA